MLLQLKPANPIKNNCPDKVFFIGNQTLETLLRTTPTFALRNEEFETLKAKNNLLIALFQSRRKCMIEGKIIH